MLLFVCFYSLRLHSSFSFRHNFFIGLLGPHSSCFSGLMGPIPSFFRYKSVGPYPDYFLLRILGPVPVCFTFLFQCQLLTFSICCMAHESDSDALASSSSLVVFCSRSGPRCSPHRSPPWACGSQAVVRRPEQETQARIDSGPEFLLAASVPVNSCTVQRLDVPYGRFGPNQPCYPPLSHGR